MPLIFEKRITRDLVRAHPHVLFVFGDNYEGWGYGGQAIAMRGEPNAVGIATKRRPAHSDRSYLYDDDLDGWIARVTGPFKRLQRHLMDNGIVVWPKDDIGSGLAQLEIRAPLIWSELQRWKRFLQQIVPETPEQTFVNYVADYLRDQTVADMEWAMRQVVLDGALFTAQGNQFNDIPEEDMVFNLNRPQFDVADAVRQEVDRTVRLPEEAIDPDLSRARISSEVRASIGGYLRTLQETRAIHPEVQVNPDGSITFTRTEPMRHIRIQSSRFGAAIDEYLREIDDGETRDR